MDKKLLFIDCDPGVDDAAALLLAAAAPEVRVIGLAAVAGNVPLERTLPNTLAIAAFAGMEDVPVYAGAPGPISGPAINAVHVHGEDGLRGHGLPPHAMTAQAETPWEALYREAETYPGQVTLLALGPLTNVAIALSQYPRLSGLLKEIVLMGGAAAVAGNVSPAAEFNILADPAAAEAVLRSGARIVICPLDVTQKSYLTPEELSQLERGSAQAQYFATVMGETVPWCQKGYGINGAILHDPAALLYVLQPELFTGKSCWAGVETQGQLSRGKLVCDAFSDAKKEPNCTLVYDVDRPAFGRAVLDIMAQAGPRPAHREGEAL